MGISQPIKTEEEYNLLLKQMVSVFHAKKNTSKGDTLEVLALLTGDYEAKPYPIR